MRSRAEWVKCLYDPGVGTPEGVSLNTQINSEINLIEFSDLFFHAIGPIDSRVDCEIKRGPCVLNAACLCVILRGLIEVHRNQHYRNKSRTTQALSVDFTSRVIIHTTT